MTELKPCGFCGEHHPVHDNLLSGNGKHTYICYGCGARGPLADTAEESRRLWDACIVPDVRSAVDAIIEDLTDRRGLRQEWEGFDLDIQDEIRNAWAECIRKAFKTTEGE